MEEGLESAIGHSQYRNAVASGRVILGIYPTLSRYGTDLLQDWSNFLRKGVKFLRLSFHLSLREYNGAFRVTNKKQGATLPQRAFKLNEVGQLV